MKVRWTARSVRVRLDDLELARLNREEPCAVSLAWAGGGWSLTLDPLSDGVTGAGGSLTVGLLALLPALNDPQHEGVTVEGAVVVRVEKDFAPEHLGSGPSGAGSRG